MKGFFTQSACVLLDRAVSLSDIEAALPPGAAIGRRNEDRGQDGWEMGEPEVVCALRPEANGHILIDVVARPWPDGMGNPETEMLLFGAWSMGHFGPFAFPGNLERAAQQIWLEAREPLQSAARDHQAFARIRSTYVLGANQNAKVIPPDYEPLAELDAVTDIALALGELPGALCYFNPNGESLRSLGFVREAVGRGRGDGPPPLDVWSNARFFNVGDAGGWALLDTVGMQQLDSLDKEVRDVEACFSISNYDPSDIDNFLRNISLYLLEHGPVIRDGDTSDGPGGVRWQARAFEDSIVHPPRPTLRWFPLDGSTPPREMTEPRPPVE